MKYFGQAEFDSLRESVCSRLSGKRLAHVLGVEKEAAALGELLLPGKIEESTLRAAALLHDVTKEYTVEQHLCVLSRAGITPSSVELAAPKTLHAISAAALIPEEYPEFDDPDVVSAVRWHTTGRAGMTLPEKIIYLADYIEPGREWPDCVRLRREFWGPEPSSLGPDELKAHLTRVLVDSFDATIASLLEERRPIHPATNEARNSLLEEQK